MNAVLSFLLCAILRPLCYALNVYDRIPLWARLVVAYVVGVAIVAAVSHSAHADTYAAVHDCIAYQSDFIHCERE